MLPQIRRRLALNVERYVLPKFKVAVEFSQDGQKRRHGYRPGDHVTGTVRANYFFGKPVDGGEINIKASAMDVQVVEVGSAQGKTDSDGAYRFDLVLPNYFAGHPLSHGAARVLVEATVKDSAGHAETRGEPITVSESPLLITAIPEGGTLVPNLENQVFILTSYPDGTPAKTRVTVQGAGIAEEFASTEEGGVAVIRVRPGKGGEKLEIAAADEEKNAATAELRLASREGEDQILLRAERAVYRAGENIQLTVFSTRQRGAAYVDIVKEGQTVLTRDVDLDNGQAELTLAATPDMAGTVDINAYLFGRDARPVGDHRLIFVQPAEELKIEAVADAPVYKPGAEAQIRFHVTNSHGEGVQAALGLEVVDEAVFALAEKQPGFAKVFFYLEQEVMKPRYEIHSLGMPDVVEPASSPQAEEHDRAARALFSATEIVNTNKFETEFGREVPTTKQAKYAQWYQVRFRTQVARLAVDLDSIYERGPKAGDLGKAFAQLKSIETAGLLDSWGTEVRLDPVPWYGQDKYYVVRSAGPDRQFDNADDMLSYILVRRSNLASSPGAGTIALEIEHDRGALNGLANITGTITDPSGAVVAGASIALHDVTAVGTHVVTVRSAKTNDVGQFSFSGVPSGEYVVQVSMAGFKTASRRLTLQARDRAVLSAVLQLGAVTQAVQVAAAPPPMMFEMAEDRAFPMAAAAPRGAMGGAPGGQMGGVMGGVFKGVATGHGAGMGGSLNALAKSKDGGEAPEAHVRSYFPEALYINPEIITDERRPRQHCHSHRRLHHHVADGDDCFHPARRAGHGEFQPEGLSGFLCRSRPARYAHAGRPGFDSGGHLQLLRLARQGERKAPAGRLVLAGR